jgi:putative PLP-dependent aminotransferase (TIGR04422 family)
LKNVFLWPQGKVLPALFKAYSLTPLKRIEDRLKEMFPSGYPVLCTSGRSALVLALMQSGVKRNDQVGIFPYASHCVLDAVSRFGTPLNGKGAVSANIRLVYHQWGYIQETNLPENTIEDCADTLCRPGTPLFPAGGRYEIWSLPKILGTTSGGVLWCRDEFTAISLRKIRDAKSNGSFQWLLRLLLSKFPGLYNYWQGAEGGLSNVSRLQTGEILAAIRKWDIIVSDRQKKLELVWPYAVKYLQRPINRLPSVVPLKTEILETELVALGINTGFRMFERVEQDKSRFLEKVLPLPVHQDMSMKKLEECLVVFKIRLSNNGI